MPDPSLRNLDVCFLAGTLGPGGAERQLYYQLRTLREMGARLRVLSLMQGEFWEEPIRALGIPVLWVGASGPPIARLWRMLAALRADPPGLVQSQHFYTNLYAAAIGRAMGLRDIGALRSDVFSEVGSHRFLGTISLRMPRVLAANNRAAIDNARALGVPAERLRLLPNVVDASLFAPVDRAGRPAVTLLAVGRFTQEKRFDRFLALLARVRAESPVPVRGLLVGDGPGRPALRQQAEALGLGDDALEFRGEVACMPAIYREADLLVLTSVFEGAPNAVLEAMAAGLPVVATDVGNLRELVTNGATGFLANPYDEREMSAMILGLARDAGLRAALGRAARDSIEAHHSLDSLPRLLSNFYKEAFA